jgi:DNA-(apurinic or apyrimidinic site) lyase
MKIDYPTRSKFINKCEQLIQENKSLLMEGSVISTQFSPKGYDGIVQVKIENDNSTGFDSNWEGTDQTRFPVRIRAAAYALFKQQCFGIFQITHKKGSLTIQLTKNIIIEATKQNVNKYFVIKKPNISSDTNKLNTNESSIEEIVKIFSEIPWEIWQKIVDHEPEWYGLSSFYEKYGFGPFSVLMLITGVNDYQLKGKAEIAYWPAINKILQHTPKPETPSDLIEILEPFYQSERLPKQKIIRLKKFLQSTLATKLWNQNPEETSKNFKEIWIELSNIMDQKPEKKTITFAMKCLGISLLMSQTYDFDFSSIPIPVDSRIKKFTQKIGLQTSDNFYEIQNVWNIVLQLLKKEIPSITMIHLDSLIWQIGTMDDQEIQRYFTNFGFPNIGKELTSSKKGTMNLNTEIKNISNGKIICFIPCCKSKEGYGGVIDESYTLSSDSIPTTWHLLENGREQMIYCIDHDSERKSAFNLYSGKLYKPLIKKNNEIINVIKSGQLRLFVISAGYGVVDAFEPINSYEALLSGKNASMWKSNGLSDIISEIIIQENPSKVFGFFSGSSNWQSSGSMYRYFFTEGVKKAKQKGLDLDVSGCFYRKEGGGFPSFKELSSLGKLFVELVDKNFDHNYIEEVKNNCYIQGDVTIGFDEI